MSNQGPYCPRCAGIMNIIGNKEYGGYKYHCPRCNFKDTGATTPMYMGDAIVTPPGAPERCSHCGAFAFHGLMWAYDNNRKYFCWRCGAPNPNPPPGTPQVTGHNLNFPPNFQNPTGYQPTQQSPQVTYPAPQPPQVAYTAWQPNAQGQYVVIKESKPKPGCWRIGLGILTILMALAVGFIGSIEFLSYGWFITGCADVLAVLVGFILGICELASGKKAFMILCIIYLFLAPIYTFLISLIFSH